MFPCTVHTNLLVEYQDNEEKWAPTYADTESLDGSMESIDHRHLTSNDYNHLLFVESPIVSCADHPKSIERVSC